MANTDDVMTGGGGTRPTANGSGEALRRKARSLLIGLCGALAFSLAVAQSTGNPKGTVAPVEQGAAKPQAGRVASDGSTGSGKLSSDSGPASARTQRTEAPGGATAGGLARRNPAGGPQSSNKGSATARPLPP